MRAWIISLEGLQALATHKVHTFFMMVGTVTGVAALITIMAIGKGTEQKVMKRVNNFGPSAIMLLAGGGKDLPPPDMTVTTLTLTDVELIRSRIENLKVVTPMAWKLYTPVKRGTGQIRSVIWGVEPEWHQAYDWYTDLGEGISAEDVASLSRVCLIGKTVAEELFGNENPIGGKIYLNKVALTVKGVLSEAGISPGGGDFDNKLILPLTTAMRRVLNVDYLGAIRIITATPDDMTTQAEKIRELIRTAHHITPPEEDDFRIVTAHIIADLARGISTTLYFLLLALAGLSLLIGGVVMMNLMLISVNARTAEIGLRRALGATRNDIFRQFLTESLSITLLGMVSGSILGGLICVIFLHTTKIALILSWEHFAIALVFTLLTGTFFGVQPARKAAMFHPAEVLK